MFKIDLVYFHLFIQEDWRTFDREIENWTTMLSTIGCDESLWLLSQA